MVPAKSPPSVTEPVANSLSTAMLAADTPLVLSNPRLPDNPIIAANAAFCAMTGYAPDDVLGSNCRFMQCPDTDPATIRRLRDAIAAGRPIEVVLLNQRRDGSRFWNRLLVAPILGPDGEILYFFGSQRDVTGDQAAASLRDDAQETQQRAVRLEDSQRAAGAASWEWHPRTGQILWSEGAASVLGTPESGQARPPPDFSAWLQRVHPEDRALAKAGAEAIARGAGRFEYRLERDGGPRWLEAVGRVLTRDAAGETVKASGIVIDVTERKAAEARARRNEARFRAVAEATSIIVFVTDEAGRRTYVSPQLSAFTGRPETHLLDDGWSQSIIEPDRPRQVAAWEQALRTGETFEVEVRIRRHDGTPVWFLERGVPLREPERLAVVGWCGTMTEIQTQVEAREALARHQADLERLVTRRTAALTEALEALRFEAVERARAEDALRQAQKMEAIGQLTGGIAHDFNNLLTAISGSMELLQTRLAQGRSSEVGRYIDASRRAVERGGALVQHLLAFARRQALDPQRVPADDLARGMFELIRRTVGAQIDVVARLQAGDAAAHCDANQLESALLNLAINARDAMPNGGTLTLATALRTIDAASLPSEPGALPGTYVEIAVIDTGTGMTPDVRDRAFDPFFTTKPIGRGTGLGLSQTYGFVRQSGGIVLLESTEGVGTAVRLLLPRDETAAQDPAAPEAAATDSNAADLRVLVVEDEEALRDLLDEALTEQGCTVRTASDGPQGLALIREGERFDLLVTDIGLPGMDGRRLAEAARDRWPDLPVLFITGYAGDGQDSRIMAGLPAGAEILGKPFTLAALTDRLSRIIRR